MKKFLILLFCLVAIGPAVLAQDEEDGGGFLTRTIEGALSGAGREVKIVGFAGALSSEATFESMTISDDQGIWLTLEDVALNWRRLALLRGRLEVESLTAASLQITRLPEPGETPVEIPAAEAEEFKFELPELPVSINVAAFEVAVIDLAEPIVGVPARLRLNASAKFDDDGLLLDLSAKRIDDVAGDFGLRANVRRDGAEIDLNLTLVEAPGGIAAHLLNLPDLPSVDLSIVGLGPLDSFTADIAVATAEQPRVKGQVNLSAEKSTDEDAGSNRRIHADIGGDITALIVPEYKEFFGPAVGLAANVLLVSDGSVDVESFSVDAQAVEIAGAVRLNTDMWPSFVDIKGKIAQDGEPVVLPGSNAGVSVSSVLLDVSFDAAQGDSFKSVFDIRDLTHEAAQVARLGLEVDGTLDQTADAVGRFVADVVFDASGIEVEDGNTRDALGQAIRGGTKISYIKDTPIEITGLSVAGDDYGLKGQAIIAGLSSGFPTDLKLEVSASDLSRFAGLAGRPLAGAAELSVEGSVTPLSSMFDLVITGGSQDVVMGMPQADAVLRGRTDLSLAAARNATGTFVRDLQLRNDAVDVAADVELRTKGSNVKVLMSLSDIALVLPEYQGAVLLDAFANQNEGGWWQVETKLDAPYDGKLRVSGLATGPDADLTFDVSAPEVKPFFPGTEGPLSVKGRLWQSGPGYLIDVEGGGPFGANIEVKGLATGPEAKVTVAAGLPDMGVLVSELAGALALNGEIARSGGDWEIDTTLEGPAGLVADIAGIAAQDASTVDLTIAGQVPLGLAGPFLAPSSLSGPLSFDLALKGPPDLDSLRGKITTTNVNFSDPNLRVGLNDVAIRVDLASSVAQLDVGADISTGGRLQVGGNIDLVSLVGDLTVALRKAVIIDPNLYSAQVEADITVNGPLAGGARIGGRIDLEEVNVTVPGTGVTSIGSVPEITHVAASKKVTATRLRAGVVPKEADEKAKKNSPAFPLEIAINAPSRIFIRGRGLNAELGGDMKIEGDTNNVVSSGSFELVRGRLDIIGKRFDLDEGTIQFHGALTPYIRFVTVTEIPDGTASIVVDGIATEPEITFTSVPEVPEDEVLALIIFGRYVSELSAFQALELANGISQLSGRASFNLLGDLREGIGLDELDVTTDEEGQTSVTAGKYITDTIYTDVTSNSEKGTDISLNIDLTESLTGKATVAEDGNSSLGLFFERDY